MQNPLKIVDLQNDSNIFVAKQRKIIISVPMSYISFGNNRKSSRRGLLGKIFDKLRIQGRMQIFEKMSQSALNHVLILQKDRTQKMLQIPLKIIDLQNDFNIFVAKQWTIRI